MHARSCFIVFLALTAAVLVEAGVRTQQNHKVTASASRSGADPSIVTIPGLGDVQCGMNSIARECRGIRYAAPVKRWAAPQPVQSWAPAVLPAMMDGPGCMQICYEPALACPNTTSEDCLVLNVFTPLPLPAQPLPVTVFLHGGTFRDGFGGGPLYNGSDLSSGAFQNEATLQQAIVVSINYRLGVFGFLYSGTNATDGGAITGNYGLADQRAALVWVRDNIVAFGGDPNRVLLWGQSAGAMSIASHMISPGSRGLFHAALTVSEPFALPFHDVASSRAATAEVSYYAGCPSSLGPDTTSCLRALPAATLLTAQVAASGNASDDTSLLQSFMPWSPTTGTRANDTVFELPNWPLDSFQGRPGAAPVADIPIACGTVASEGTLFIDVALPGPFTSELEYIGVVALFLLGDAAAALAQYPAPVPVPDGYDFAGLTSNMTTAAGFRCAIRNATRSLAALPGRTTPVYLYQYNHLLSWSAILDLSPRCVASVCHGSDLPLWFSPSDPAVANYTAAERTLGGVMGGYVNTFAATGKPGGGWAPVTPASTPRLDIDVPTPVMNDDPGAAECVLWDRIGYVFPRQ